MKSGIILTVRLESKRLKNKALLKLNNITVIEHIIKRLKKTKLNKNIILATSNATSNKIFLSIARKHKIKIFFGSNNDVINRIYEAAKYYKLDNVLCVTGDSPFIDTTYLDKLNKFHLKNKNDFSKISGLPIGCFCYAITQDALRKINMIKKSKNTEIWYDYVYKNSFFKKKTLHVKERKKFFPKLRVTLDTQEDYKLIKILYLVLYRKNKLINTEEIINFCKKNPELLKINSQVKQKKGPKLM